MKVQEFIQGIVSFIAIAIFLSLVFPALSTATGQNLALYRFIFVISFVILILGFLATFLRDR